MLELTRLRRRASLLRICALARIQTQSWFAQGSSTVTRIDFSRRADKPALDKPFRMASEVSATWKEMAASVRVSILR